MSSALIWELTKNYHSKLAKNVNRQVWSKEAGNLSGKNSFKYSGLANLNSTVDISEVDGAVAISVSSKKTGKFATSLCKKNTRRSIQAAGAVAASKRPDLKRAAMARAAAISKGLKKRAALAAAAN